MTIDAPKPSCCCCAATAADTARLVRELDARTRAYEARLAKAYGRRVTSGGVAR